jgi:hypothetical protein
MPQEFKITHDAGFKMRLYKNFRYYINVIYGLSSLM